MLFKMCKEFHELKFYDEEIWNKLIFDIIHKKRVSNLHFLSAFHVAMTEMNKDPKNPFFGKLDA